MYVLLDDQVTHRQRLFNDPRYVLVFRAGDDVGRFFARVEAALSAGFHLAGLFAYEFGAALEPRLAPIAARGDVLARLGVFGAPSDHPPATMLYRAAPPAVSLAPAWTETDYRARFDAVRRYLRAGDAYQVNLTFPMRGTVEGGAQALYAGYRRRQPGRYGAVVSLGGPEVVSFSPELFFQREGRDMRMRPMKGTRPLGAEGDMREDAKSRAENLMIVDLLRNDLSRLCEPGSVRVPELFALEDYPTLTQMTSEVTGRLRAGVGWADIFRALFPCGSVTGAPKIRAMEIIHELEAGPRGAYCGSVGYIAPDGDAAFSVAIRTAVLDGGALRYDVGSGVVLDSDGGDEYRECLLKASLLQAAPEGAIETMRWEPGAGVVRAARHIRRLHDSHPDADIRTALGGIAADKAQRVRVEAVGDAVSTTVRPLQAMAEPVPVALSRHALSDTVQTTAFKTTRRDFYDGERARVGALSGAAEVLFAGDDGLMCEGSFTSLFIQRGRALLTPAGPGLLPGVLRAELLETGVAREVEIGWADVLGAEAVFIGNSLRGLMRARVLSEQAV